MKSEELLTALEEHMERVPTDALLLRQWAEETKLLVAQAVERIRSGTEASGGMLGQRMREAIIESVFLDAERDAVLEAGVKLCSVGVHMTTVGTFVDIRIQTGVVE